MSFFLSEVFDDDFQLEFASFLSRPGAADLPLPPTIHSQWIASLLTGIMRSVGRVVDVPRITKRVRGYVSWSQNDHEAKLSAAILPEPRVPGFANQDEWRRSSLWLFIRVAVQMAVRQSPLRRAAYKGFMLFFVCTLAGDADNAKLSSDLLHLMSSKVHRRLSKLGSSTPDWLSEMALKTHISLGDP